MKIFNSFIYCLRPLFLSLICCFLVPIPQARGQYDINILKAAYIERITRFIEWPDNKRDTVKFRIGVYANAEFADVLANTLKERPIKGRLVEVNIISDLRKINNYDLCYFENINEAQIKDIIFTANKEGILIFTNETKFGKKGGHINFYVEDNKLKFEINYSSLTEGNFRTSYILLSNSKVI
ncbi:MAG: YfiR family protein [Bacteroidales bacterium]